MPTAAEIAALKENWALDPCWDIETTEGFEAHHDELAAYRDEMETKWAMAHETRVQAESRRLQAKAAALGTNNLLLAAHLDLLERRIADLERRLTTLRQGESR